MLKLILKTYEYQSGKLERIRNSILINILVILLKNSKFNIFKIIDYFPNFILIVGIHRYTLYSVYFFNV